MSSIAHPALVWFKRDLRVVDHAALHAAHARAPSLALRGLYIVEPALWALPDAAGRHGDFLTESLSDLGQALRAMGGSLTVCCGEAVDVLARLHKLSPFEDLLSHEETGNAFTYARDLAVAAWCRQAGVRQREWPQMGVVRRLQDRDHWHLRWEQFMRQPLWPGPEAGHVADLDAAPYAPLMPTPLLAHDDTPAPKHGSRMNREGGRATRRGPDRRAASPAPAAASAPPLSQLSLDF